MTVRRIVSPRAAPSPASARYSHAVEANGTLYVTGQLPVDPDDPAAPLPDGIVAQTAMVFRNLAAIVEDAGYTLADTVFARVYLLDLERDYVGFNSVFHRHFADPAALPGRTTVGVAKLGRGALVEVDLTLARARG
jgi:2-iminobutanoate/2-iminopropanoate deaminase